MQHPDPSPAGPWRRKDALRFALSGAETAFGLRIDRAAWGADVLHLGCGDGSGSLPLEPRVRSLIGLDASELAVARARASAERLGARRARFDVADAEATGLADASVDLVFGAGVLHRLDVPRVAAEVRRVLRPGGRAIFWEPLGHNAAAVLRRRLAPRPGPPRRLLRRDVARLGRPFASCEVEPRGLATLASMPFRGRRVGPTLRSVGEEADQWLLALPGLRWQAWTLLIELRA